MLNTIRMAMFARRREIEVMKLVGATNWFIRVPFMLEGLVQGVIGAVVAIGALVHLQAVLREVAAQLRRTSPWSAASCSPPASWSRIYVLLGITGCVVGAIGAGIAVTRFLDV